MKSTETITYISIAAIAISLFFIGTELTGYAFANDTGVVNVTISDSAEISFTTAFLNFGSGAVTPGTVASVDSEGGGNGNGDWSAVNGELVLENIGNVNVTLELQADKTPAQFIEGSADQAFEVKVVNYDGNGGNIGACTGNSLTSYTSLSTSLITACATSFGFANETDEIKLEFNMTIPDDATGTKTIEIKAVGTY